MVPYLTERFGNAASTDHVFGREAMDATEIAREQVADLIGASPEEIVFTSGATEADNMAVKGAAWHHARRGRHIVTTTIEHMAVLGCCAALENDGWEVTRVGVDREGRVDPEAIHKAIRTDTTLVSIIWANNEIGVVQDIEEIGAICHEKGVVFHTDAVQGLGRLPLDVKAMNIDLASISAHKMYGPKGIGALYVRQGRPTVHIQPLIDGGGHERGMRSGTIPVHQVVGFGKAAELAGRDLAEGDVERVRTLRDRLWDGIRSRLDDVHVNGSWAHRLPNNLNVHFAYVDGETLMMDLPEIACSAGSACTSTSIEPSHVLMALGDDTELARSSVRFGVGRFNTEEEIDYAMARVVRAVRRLRELSPLYEMTKQGIDPRSLKQVGH